MSTELVNPEIDRVDAVNGPATGIPFLIFKDAQGGPAVAAESAPVAKSEDDAEDVAAEVADADTANIDGAPVADAAIVDAEPGDAAWEAVDAAKARVAVAGLAALQKLVSELAQRESAEGDGEAWDLMDAGDALDFALGVLARFSVTEQMEADDAAADAELASSRASGLLKALHLEVHEKPEGDAPAEAPAAAVAPVEDALAPEAPAVPAVPGEAPAAPPVAKATDGVLPAGLMELLSTFVESYSHFIEGQKSGAQDELNTEDAAAAPVEAAPAAPAAPVEAPKAPEAPDAHAAPAEHAEAHEAAPAPAPAHAAPAAPAHVPAAPAAEAPKAEAPKAEAPAEAEDPAEKFKKSMQDAVAAAVAEATAPLLKQIDALERTPVDSGPLLAGQTPGNAGTPLVRGQEEGAVTKGLGNGFAAAQTAPGNNPLAEGIKGLYARTR